MTADLYLPILDRAHGEYVEKLARELTTTLKALEEMLRNPVLAPATRSSHTERMAELERLLATGRATLAEAEEVHRATQRAVRERSARLYQESIAARKNGNGAAATVVPQAPSSPIVHEASPPSEPLVST